MLIPIGAAISAFDIVKVKKHMAFNQCGKISDFQNRILLALLSDYMIRELGVQKGLKRSNYNYFVKKSSIGSLWNTASDACVLLNETEVEWYDRTEEAFCCSFMTWVFMSKSTWMNSSG